MGGFEVHYREITVEDIPSVKSLHVCPLRPHIPTLRVGNPHV